MLLYFTYFSSNSFIYEFYCVLLYILYCFFSFTYTVYLSVCMSPVYVYGPSCLILNKMTMIMMIDNI